MSKTIVKRRYAAFVAQSNLCYYCRKPMWVEAPEVFARAHSLTEAQAEQRRCTAEHLRAQCDGGSHSRKNIAAACLYCNQQRHRLATPLGPKAYKQYVRQKQLAGRWPT